MIKAADLLIQFNPIAQPAIREAQPDRRIAPPPVPEFVYGEPAKQRLAAAEQLTQRIEKQRLAEPTRAREKIVLALLDQPQGETGFVDILAVALADLAKGLDTDGQDATGHGLGRRGVGGDAGEFSPIRCAAQDHGSA